MLPLRTAASLLAAASDTDGLAAVVALLGFTGRPAPLDAGSLGDLALPDDVRAASIVRGAGTLRALLVEARPGAAVRDVVRRVAARLSRRAPHRHWLLAAAEPDGGGLALASWTPDRRPRVAALVADRARIVDSDAETLRALAAVDASSDALVHARWLDVLGREALTRRFYAALEARVHGLADAVRGRASEDDARALALLCVSRLLFLAFLEAKGWLDGDHAFLLRTYERAAGRRGGVHRGALDPLFFGTLNTPVRRRATAARAFGRVPFLNGGLFARTALERRCPGAYFPDDEIGRVLDELLCRYRFTAREDASGWSEAAVDPEMLGRAFETLMSARERKRSGTYFTPQPLVEHVTTEALAHALSADGECDVVRAALRGEPAPDAARDALLERAREIRLLDPACGTGAFLVHALERIAALRATLGDPSPADVVRRDVLTRAIFGVDVNPTAVWLCELRLWLSAVIESRETDPLRVPALPNLDRNVRVGDSLAGGAFLDMGDRAIGRRVAALRERYVRATGTRKLGLLAAIERAERASAIAAIEARIARAGGERREAVLLARARDLFGERPRRADADERRARELRAESRRLRDRVRALREGAALPFTFAAHFADVAAAGGFHVVVGNPPWVRPHHVTPAARAALRRDFRVARDAGWSAGSTAARAGRGFSAQVDVSALFVERSMALARPGGVAALLVPSKLWRSLAGGGVRRLLQEESRIARVEDWSDARALFDAAVYPSLVLARRNAAEDGEPAGAPRVAPLTHVVVHGREDTARWRCAPRALPFDRTAGSPWLLLPPDARCAFDRLMSAGTPLADSAFGAPRLGVKCGANDAFLVEICGTDPAHATIAAGTGAARRQGRIERELLRPLVRGETILPWRARADHALVWTHGDDGAPLERLPPLAMRWLSPWRRRLAARSDLRAGTRWWALFRLDGAGCDLPRVVWPDVGRSPRAAVLPAGDPRVALNSCYVVRAPSADDAHALAALLNGPLAAAWLGALAEPARGGYRRHLGWTLALLPLPRDWPAAVRLLAPLGEQGALGRPPSAELLLDRALLAYGLRAADVAPLLR